MNKLSRRTLATSLTAFAFLVVGSSGVLMYFHLLKEYVGDLHEIVGLFFVAVVAFHLFYNFKSLKSYFHTKIFKGSALLLGTVALAFILNTSGEGNPKKSIIEAVLNAPLQSSLQVLNQDMEDVKSKFAAKGIVISENDTIAEIAKKQKTSPFDMINVIMQK